MGMLREGWLGQGIGETEAEAYHPLNWGLSQCLGASSGPSAQTVLLHNIIQKSDFKKASYDGAGDNSDKYFEDPSRRDKYTAKQYPR